jgi:hypothetical protein
VNLSAAANHLPAEEGRLPLKVIGPASNRRLSARIQDPPGYKIRIRSDLNRGRVPSAEDEPAPQSRRYVRGFANLLPQRSIEVLGYPASAIPKTNIGRVVNRC